MIKRLLSVLLAGMIVLSLVGCGKADEGEKNDETKSDARTTINENVTTKTQETTEAVQGITPEDIDSYGFEKDTPWINTSLGIVYDFPKKMIASVNYGSVCLSYMHGCSHEFLSKSMIYVEKSLEGNTDLETLASDIIAEKNSEKYANVYQFGLQDLKPFQIAKTENVRINDIDAVYFESEVIPTEDGLSYKFVGYSFEYMGQAISAYGIVYVEANDIHEDMIQTLQYMISSIRSHNNETIQELGGNLKFYLDDGGVSVNETVTVNAISGHGLNGVLLADANRPLVTPDLAYFEWDGRLETIYESSLKVNPYTQEDGDIFPSMYSVLEWVSFDTDDEDNWYNRKINEIVKEENVTIHGIDMIKYMIKSGYETGRGYYVGAYVFIVDGQPYIVNYRLSNTLYEENLPDMTEAKREMLIRQTEAVTESIIYTLRILEPDDEMWTAYVSMN